MKFRARSANETPRNIGMIFNVSLTTNTQASRPRRLINEGPGLFCWFAGRELFSIGLEDHQSALLMAGCVRFFT